MVWVTIPHRFSVNRCYLVVLLTILSFNRVTLAQCSASFSPNSTVIIAANTACDLTAEPNQIWRLEVKGNLTIRKTTPPIQLDVRELIVYPTGRISADGSGFTAGSGEGKGTNEGSGGK